MEFKQDIDDIVLLIRADIEGSFDKGVITGICKKKYAVHVVCNKHCGTVLGARCGCKAGLGGYYKHVAAVLFHVMDHQRKGSKVIPVETSSTSRLQSWHKPKVAGQSCIRFNDLNLESFNYDKDNYEPEGKRPRTDFNSFNSCPDGQNCVSKDRIQTFADELSSLSVASQLLEILKANSYEPDHQDTNDTSTHVESSDNVFQPVPFNKDISVSEEALDFYTDTVMITTSEDQTKLSRETQGQSKNSRWFEERSKRITASNFRSVVKREKFPCDKLFDRIVSSKSQTSSQHCVWGQQAEPIALAQYKLQKEKQGYAVKGKDLGLVVNPHFPYLGASPDWFVELRKDGKVTKGPVEVKSLSKYKELTPKEAANFDTFYSYKDGMMKLDCDHQYYYQIQGQLEICGVEWCDLVVWTPVGMAVERIFRNKEFWGDCLSALTDFYFKYVLPALIKKK